MSTHEPLLIRPFVEEDRPSLRRLFLESRRANFTWLNTAAFSLEDFDRQTEGESILVACVDGNPVAFAAWWPPENFLHHLYVTPAKIGQGIGRPLLAAALTHMGRPARLKVMTPNTRARRLYEREGWTIETQDHSADGPFYLMRFA